MTTSASVTLLLTSYLTVILFGTSQAELSPVFRTKASNRVDEIGKWGFDQDTKISFPPFQEQSHFKVDPSFQPVQQIPQVPTKPQVSPVNRVNQVLNGNIGNWVNSFFESPCECGKEKKYFRITGGEETQLNQYPWMASISRPGFSASWEHFCGGSLINSQFVVTAAHCVDKYTSRPKELRVTFGEHNLENTAESLRPESHFAVEAVYKHPLYSVHKTYDYDLALLKLVTPVNFVSQDYIRPICLSDRWMSIPEGTDVTTAGWGQESFGGISSSVLKHVDVKIVSQEFCRNSYQGSFPRDISSVVCAGNILQGGEDACQGDSGGPLMLYRNKRYHLVGLVSAGSGCGDKRFPGIYTNLLNTYARAFIDLSFFNVSGGRVTTCKKTSPFRDAE